MLKATHMRARGFTLIEAMITLAVLSLLLMIGLPGMNTWLQNTQLRASAEAIHSGLQLTRAEALRRNVPVRFQLVDSLAATCALIATGIDVPRASWVISLADPAGLCDALESDVDAPQILQKRGAGEGSPNAVVNATGSSVVFNGLGRVSAGGAAVRIDVTNPSGGNCQTAGGPMRCLRINISSGGEPRMCDPAVLDAADPRRCL
jgi:type IV fimbrial biogenesis protein FimT